MIRILGLTAAAALFGCPQSTPIKPADTASTTDTAPTGGETGVDTGTATTPPSPAPRESRAIVSAAGQLTSATYTLDAQVGAEPVVRLTSAQYTLEIDSPVLP